MTTVDIFRVQLGFGYLAWLLCVLAYVVPWLRELERAAAMRAIATLHSFRFFGLVFLVPGVVGPGLPDAFAVPAAFGDLATSVLAVGALLAFRMRPLFWTLVVAFNVVGAADLVLDTIHAIGTGVPAHAGELGVAYAIPILYVPLLMITHVVAFYRMATGDPGSARRAGSASDIVAA